MLGRPRQSPAGVSDATKVRQANRHLHRRLELARQAQQNLLDDQLAGLDRRVMRKRELPSVLSPNYDDAVQQMAHSEISLALKMPTPGGHAHGARALARCAHGQKPRGPS